MYFGRHLRFSAKALSAKFSLNCVNIFELTINDKHWILWGTIQDNCRCGNRTCPTQTYSTQIRARCAIVESSLHSPRLKIGIALPNTILCVPTARNWKPWPRDGQDKSSAISSVIAICFTKRWGEPLAKIQFSPAFASYYSTLLRLRMVSVCCSIIAIAAIAMSQAQVTPQGINGVSMYNNCNTTVYSWTVTYAGTVNTSNGILPGKWYWEPYQYPTSGTGTSIKMSVNDWNAAGPITQLEYSFNSDTIWYDLSNIDCGPTGSSSTEPCPFLTGGMFLTSSQNQCPTVTCESGIVECKTVYNVPDDNSVVRTCAASNNLVFFMCSSQEIPSN